MSANIINVAIVTVVFVAAILVIRNYIARGGKGDCCGGHGRRTLAWPQGQGRFSLPLRL